MSAPALEQGHLKILFLLSILNDARDSKRIAMLQQAGFEVEAVAFDRGFFSGRPPNCPVEIIGKILNGHYVQRIPKLIAALGRVRRAIRRNDIVYTSGIDMALTGLVARFGLKKPLILEVGDIRKIQVSHNLSGYAVRCMDRCIAMRSALIVATAPGFIDGYYRNWLNVNTPAIVIENKLEASVSSYNSTVAPAKGIPLVDRALRIGYFGMLRCDWSWRVLEGLAASAAEKVQIVVAGRVIAPADLQSRAARFKNIDFRGEFRSPEQLPELYGDVDLVWACYPGADEGKADWRWAQAICRSNRFYESCLFQVPIISKAGSGDAVQIASGKIGLIIEEEDIKAVVDRICKINSKDLQIWKENIAKLPQEIYLYTVEAESLKKALHSSMTKGSSYLSSICKERTVPFL